MITSPIGIAIGIGVVLFGIGIVPVYRLIGPNPGQHAAPRSIVRPDLAYAVPRTAARHRSIAPPSVLPELPVVTQAQPPWTPAAHSADWETRAMPGYVADAIGHGGDIDAAVDSMWTRALGRQLSEQIRGGEL